MYALFFASYVRRIECDKACMLCHLFKFMISETKKLENSITNKENVYNLPFWEQFLSTPNFKNIQYFMLQQLHIITCKIRAMMFNIELQSKQGFCSSVASYCSQAVRLLEEGFVKQSREELFQINHIIDATKSEQDNNKYFRLNHFDSEYQRYEMKDLLDYTKKKIAKIQES